ncbi:MAG: S-methyl-5-thioribose-1-phosphate isomerase [archaeon]
MTENSVDLIIKNLKNLKIQGASQVKRNSILAARILAMQDKSPNLRQFEKNFKLKLKKIAFARATEPQARESLRQILLAEREACDLKEAKENILEKCADLEKENVEAMKKIVEYGVSVLKKDSIVFTHCHSHTVENIFINAFEKGHLQKVICTETRPRYQGRITAENLSKKGIPTIHIVDGAASTFMKEADFFFTGADAIVANASIVNKIGTSLISLKAKTENVPHYVCAHSYCYDPETYHNFKEPIEQRDSNEVWDKKLKNLKILNPAFDVTEAEFIKGIISEYGIFNPKKFCTKIAQVFGIKKGKYFPLKELLK